MLESHIFVERKRDGVLKARRNDGPSLAKVLPEEQVMAFHRTTAQLLFLSARVRRDIQPATAVLTTQLRLPYEDDWGQGQEGAELSEGYSAHASHPVSRLTDTLKMVGGRCSIYHA